MRVLCVCSMMLVLGCGITTTGNDGGVVDAGPFDADDCKHSSTETAVLSIGEGMLSHHPLDEDAVLEWEAGPQGGHHIWVSVRLTGLRQSGTVLTIRGIDVDDPAQRVLSDRRVVFSFRRDEGGYCVLNGLRLQLDENPEVELASLDGHRVRVHVSALDPEGATADDEKVVVVRAPAVDGGP